MTFRRLILQEVVPPIFQWCALIALLLISFGFIKNSEVLLGSSASLGALWSFVLASLPAFFVQAIPPALFIGIFVGLGRLAADRELAALQALGVNPLRIFAIPWALAALFAVLMLYLVGEVQPRGITAARETVREIVRNNLASNMHPGEFREEIIGLTFYAGGITPAGVLSDVLIFDEREVNHKTLLLVSKGSYAGSSTSDAINFNLGNGELMKRDQDGADVVLTFQNGTLTIPLDRVFHEKNQAGRAEDELSLRSLYESTREAKRDGGDPKKSHIALNLRFSQALSPLAFAVLAAPLAMGRRQRGRGIAILFGVGCYIGYYLLARANLQLEQFGTVPLWLYGQLPNLILIGLGLVLVLRVQRRGAL